MNVENQSDTAPFDEPFGMGGEEMLPVTVKGY